jgi:hypothetical protein
VDEAQKYPIAAAKIETIISAMAKINSRGPMLSILHLMILAGSL